MDKEYCWRCKAWQYVEDLWRITRLRCLACGFTWPDPRRRDLQGDP